MRPQDFLIGIRDFFAILIPGATFLLLRPFAFIPESSAMKEPMTIFGLTIAAYLIGSVASAIGSLLDFVVDPLLNSRCFRSRIGRKLLRRERLANRLRCAVLRQCNPPIAPGRHPETVKEFWWNHLRLNCPAAISELDRIEAIQKLFRSLVTVFAGAAIVFAWPGGLQPPDPAIGAAHLTVAAAGAAGLYASGRYSFLSSLYRLAAAYCVARCEGPGR